MDNRHEEVLLRMKTMDGLLDSTLEELLYEADVLDVTCYRLRMYAEWMMGTVGLSSSTYSEFAKLKDSFLTFEVLLTLDSWDVTEYVSSTLYLQVKKFSSLVGEIIESIEEVM